MNSQANDLLIIALGILEDVRVAYPEYRGVERDKARLSRLVQTRGLGVFTLDLPQLDPLLLEGLATERLVAKGPLARGVSKRIHVPRLFAGLWLRVFDKSSCLLPEVDATAIAFLRQLFCLGKKIEVGCSPERLDKTIEAFHDIEQDTRDPSLRWNSDSLDPDWIGHGLHFRDGLVSYIPLLPEDGRDATERRLRFLCDRLQIICDRVTNSLGSLDPVAFSTAEYYAGRGIGFKHGPGAVADRSHRRKPKYEFSNWSAKLDKVFPFEDCGALSGYGGASPDSSELPSRLIAVPKTAKGPRLIASEPTEHQWCQQIVKTFLERGIKKIFKGSFIDFKDQEKSKVLALKASQKGDLATVDLSSASDRLSCWAVERFARGNPLLLGAMHSCRTRQILDEISSPARYVLQKKFVSQGTAMTFPTQTLFFLCCVLACLPGRMDIGELTRRWSQQVQVFGDDIIIPKIGYADLVLLLHYLGLKVNEEKSFSTGLFRESCGMDAYAGFDVTPVKPKGIGSDGPASRAALLDLTNNLFKKGYWKACAAAESIDRRRFLRHTPVVGLESGAIGRTSFCGPDATHLRKRWNDVWQREEVRAWSFTGSCKNKPTNSISGVFQYITENPSPFAKWTHGMPGTPRTSDGMRWVFGL